MRFLLGIGRDAVAAAFADFRGGRLLESAQERFVNLIIDYLKSNGVLGIATLYESPFTALAPNGPEALFRESDNDELVDILDAVQESAIPPAD